MSTKLSISDVEFQLNGQNHLRRTLVTSRAALMVFDNKNKPKDIEKYLGTPIKIKVSGVELQGHLVKESQSSTEYYSVEFNESDPGHKKVLAQIEEQGAFMPPRRKYARLDARADIDAAVPAYAYVYIGNDSFFFSIVNFTIGGLLIESVSSTIGLLKVQQRIRFDIFLSDDRTIPGTVGEVVRVKDQVTDPVRNEHTIRFGIKILEMGDNERNVYSAVIRDYCKALVESINSK